MSVLNKIPFINGVLDNLGKSNLQTLRELMDGEGDRTVLFRTMNVPAGGRTNITEIDKGVHLCSLQVGPTLYHGYLLYSDHDCVLLNFTDFQNILMFSIDVPNRWFETISEYLDINELRGRVNDLLIEGGEQVSVQVNDIDSENESAGKVIASDGEGGAIWSDNFVTKNTDQTITGKKSFVGSLEITHPTDARYFAKLQVATLLGGPYYKLDVMGDSATMHSWIFPANGGGVVATTDDINDRIRVQTPARQTTTSVAINALININGRELSNYSTEDVTIGGGGYRGIKILRDGSALTEELAQSYLTAMTGSNYVPKYNYDMPQNSYIVFANGKIYKPQWDATNGLVLYYVNQVAFDSVCEKVANKVTTVNSSSTDTQYPSAKAVWTGLTDVREIAEGKCNTFVVYHGDTVASIKNSGATIYNFAGNNITSAVNNGDYDSVTLANPDFNSQNDSITIYSDTYIIVRDTYLGQRFTTSQGIVLDTVANLISEILQGRLGDIFLVGEVNVPDRWVSSMNNYLGEIVLNKLETTKINLNNYVTLGGPPQTISSAKTFTVSQTFGNTTTGVCDLMEFVNSSSYTYKFIRNGNEFALQSNGNTTWFVNDTQVFSKNSLPITSNTYNLGSASYKWKDAYINGFITDGTNQYSVVSSYKLLFNKYNSNNSITELDYEVENVCSKSSATTFTLKAAPTGCYPEYKAMITNSGSASIVLTFTNVNNIITSDDEDAYASSNTITLAPSKTIEINIVNGNCVCVVW